MTSIQINVKKEVFLKIADYIGLEKEELFHKYKINIEENNDKVKVTVAKLRKIAESYKIPISMFFLSEPPELPHIESTRLRKEGLSKESKQAIREAFHIQGAYQEVVEKMPAFDLPEFRLENDPRKAGEKIKEILGIDKIRKQCKDHREFLKRIREKLADKGILLLQLRLGSELRGFSISDELPFIIVVNKRENDAGKIFTTFHELAHILLREPRLDLSKDLGENGQVLERWCEEFAAAVLLDKKIKETFLELRKKGNNYSMAINRIEEKYYVSKHAVAVELLKQKLISQKEYDSFINSIKVSVEKKEKKGGPPRATIIIYEKGEPFIKELVKAYEKGKIDDTEAIEILETGEKVWQEIVSSVS